MKLCNFCLKIKLIQKKCKGAFTPKAKLVVTWIIVIMNHINKLFQLIKEKEEEISGRVILVNCCK